MALASLLLLLQAEAVDRLSSDDIEIREAARQELVAMGAKALPALRAADHAEAWDVVERILDAAERAFLGGRPFGLLLGARESKRRVGELEALFPGCRIRATLVQCGHRNLCDHGGLFIYGVAEDDAEVFVIRERGRYGDALLRRLAPAPGREEETRRLLEGGWPANDTLIFDTQGRLVRIQRRGP